MQPILIALSSILALISPVIYMQSILKGKTKPHRTTRIVLFIVSSLAFASLFAQGNTVAIWLAAIATIQAIFILMLSIKRGMGGWAPVDILCMGIALAGIALWKTTNDPVVALIASIAADFTGMIPAMIKTFHFPETEDWRFFGLDTIAATLVLFAITTHTWQEYAYPVYILLINAAMVGLIFRKKLLVASTIR